MLACPLQMYQPFSCLELPTKRAGLRTEAACVKFVEFLLGTLMVMMWHALQVPQRRK